jgi:hypothetical protein
MLSFGGRLDLSHPLEKDLFETVCLLWRCWVKNRENTVLLGCVRCLLLVCFLVGGVSLVGCGGAPNGESPFIRQFRFAGQDPQDPQIFYFEISWLDNQGDLIVFPAEGVPTNGSLLFTLQDLDTGEIPKEVSLKIDPLLVKVGELSGVISKVGIRVDADRFPSRIKFTLLMTDANGNRSNNPWVIVRANL